MIEDVTLFTRKDIPQIRSKNALKTAKPGGNKKISMRKHF